MNTILLEQCIQLREADIVDRHLNVQDKAWNQVADKVKKIDQTVTGECCCDHCRKVLKGLWKEYVKHSRSVIGRGRRLDNDQPVEDPEAAEEYYSANPDRQQCQGGHPPSRLEFIDILMQDFQPTGLWGPPSYYYVHLLEWLRNFRLIIAPDDDEPENAEGGAAPGGEIVPISPRAAKPAVGRVVFSKKKGFFWIKCEV